MRISGNYFERYVYTLLPWILCGAVSLLLILTMSFLQILLVIVLGSLLICFCDSLAFRKHKLFGAVFRDDKLFVGNRCIKESEIISIRPYFSWSNLSTVLEINLRDKTSLKFMDKPKTFFYKSGNKMGSKSLDILFARLPSLRNKLRAEQY